MSCWEIISRIATCIGIFGAIGSVVSAFVVFKQLPPIKSKLAKLDDVLQERHDALYKAYGKGQPPLHGKCPIRNDAECQEDCNWYVGKNENATGQCAIRLMAVAATENHTDVQRSNP